MNLKCGLSSMYRIPKLPFDLRVKLFPPTNQRYMDILIVMSFGTNEDN